MVYRARRIGRRRSHVARRPVRKFTGKRKRFSGKRKGGLLKLVKSAIMRAKPTKKVNYSQLNFNLGSNELQTVIANVFLKVLVNQSSYTGAISAVGGDVNAAPGQWIGDTCQGNRIRLSGMSLRGVIRNFTYSPMTRVRLYLVRYSIGDAPTLATMFMGLTECKLIDRFCNDNFTLIAQKEFRLVPAVHTGNYYTSSVPCKPGGGTAANDAVGTYWDTPGVGILGNTNTTYDTENLVYFNANTVSGSWAPKAVPFQWNINSKKLKKLVFEEGTAAVNPAGGWGYTATSINQTKDFTYGLFSYTYTNAVVGTAPTLASAILDEFTWEYRFKELD
nr:MAG: capsid protein [Cressdnaviricota sp.]